VRACECWRDGVWNIGGEEGNDSGVRNAKMMQTACSVMNALMLADVQKKSSHALENFFHVTYYTKK